MPRPQAVQRSRRGRKKRVANRPAGGDRIQLDVIAIEHGRLYAERIPDATLRVVDDCGHAMYFERTEAFAGAVIEFLTGSEAAA